MGLIIKPTKEKKIIISGTEIEISQIYGRLTFAGHADGKTLEIGVAFFASKETFEQNQPIFTTLKAGNLNAQLLPTQKQSVETAHAYMQKAISDLGFEVEIDL